MSLGQRSIYYSCIWLYSWLYSYSCIHMVVFIWLYSYGCTRIVHSFLHVLAALTYAFKMIQHFRLLVCIHFQSQWMYNILVFSQCKGIGLYFEWSKGEVVSRYGAAQRCPTLNNYFCCMICVLGIILFIYSNTTHSS